MSGEKFDKSSAAIISVGDEILLGQTVDSNSNYIARSLSLSGITVVSIRAVSDDNDSIKRAIDDAAEACGIVILTGGLGPTSDDLTRPALAEYFGSKLIFREDLLREIQQRYEARGVKMTENVRILADFPEGAEAIPNCNGTAPGIFFKKDDLLLFSVPGVPREMKGMIDDFVVPKLGEKNRGKPFKYRVIRTAGMAESLIAECLGDFPFPDVHLAYLPRYGCVDLRISALAEDEEKTEARLDLAEVYIQSLLEDIIYGYDEVELAQAVGDMLRERKWKLAVAESCTGGLLGSTITDISGSSDYFEGGFITYSNYMKISKLGLPADLIEEKGAVSEEVALAMAQGAAEKTHSEVGIGITGVAGPTGGTQEKPVGTVFIAVITPEKNEARKYSFKDDRILNRQRSALAALIMLFGLLKDKREEKLENGEN